MLRLLPERIDCQSVWQERGGQIEISPTARGVAADVGKLLVLAQLQRESHIQQLQTVGLLTARHALLEKLLLFLLLSSVLWSLARGQTWVHLSICELLQTICLNLPQLSDFMRCRRLEPLKLRGRSLPPRGRTGGRH